MTSVAARLLLVAVHALLHDRPLLIVGHEEPVQIKVESILNGGTVNLRNEPTRARQLGAIEADASPSRRNSSGVFLEWPTPRATFPRARACEGGGTKQPGGLRGRRSFSQRA